MKTADIDESYGDHPYVHGTKMAYLFVIQMGEHPDMRAAACRIASVTASFLTMMMWIYYNCDITAEMTSGPPPLPINNFDDVLHYGYKVIVDIPFHKGLLADGAPGKLTIQCFLSN